jgi:fibronectin type 3 domain-containing protein
VAAIGVTVSWQPVPGATAYNLYWSATSGVTASNGTKIANVNSPYTQNGLNAASTYYYVVTAVNSSGESAPSSQASALTSADIPAAPTGVSASGGNNQTSVSWGAVSGATTYNIYWSTNSGVTRASGTKITAVALPFTHVGLSANTTYYYILTAVNGAGESTPSGQVSATTATVAGVAPSAPTGISASGSTNRVSLSWGPVSGATSYNIYRSSLNNITKNTGIKITGVTSPYQNTGLTAASTYYFVVTALNASGESIDSTVASATTSLRDGVALYASNCSCHGLLTSSAKKGSSTAATLAAITGNRGGMGSLSTLTSEQVQAISDVLSW